MAVAYAAPESESDVFEPLRKLLMSPSPATTANTKQLQRILVAALQDTQRASAMRIGRPTATMGTATENTGSDV